MGIGDPEARGLDNDTVAIACALVLLRLSGHDSGNPSGRHGVDGARHGPVNAVVDQQFSLFRVPSHGPPAGIIEQAGNTDDFTRCKGQGQAARTQGGRVELPGGAHATDIAFGLHIVATHPATVDVRGIFATHPATVDVRGIFVTHPATVDVRVRALDLPPGADVPRLARVVFAQDLVSAGIDTRDHFIGETGPLTHIDCAGGRMFELGALGCHGIPPDG